jgi:glycerophosphoryl diester phosphodiesterase
MWAVPLLRTSGDDRISVVRGNPASFIHLAQGLFGVAIVCATGCGPRSDVGRSIAAMKDIPCPALIAHRGASYLAPEETRAAYLLALDLGADFLEVDVQRTRDGVLVALHDDGLERTTNVATRYKPRGGSSPGDPVDYAVGKFTWAEIQQLDAGEWFNVAYPRRARDSYRDLRVLRLEQVLDIAGSGSRTCGVFLETKSPLRYPGIERQLVELLRSRGWPARGTSIMFQSFVMQSLDSLRVLAPEIPRFLLAERGTQRGDHLDAAQRIEAGCAPHAIDVLAHPGFVGAAHRRSLLVYLWVLDEPYQMAAARWLGIDGIFTNRIEAAVVSYRRVTSVDVDASLRKMDKELRVH